MQIFDTITVTNIICYMINIVSLVSNFVSGGFASLQLKDLQKRYMRIVIGVARPDMIFLFYHL